MPEETMNLIPLVRRTVAELNTRQATWGPSEWRVGAGFMEAWRNCGITVRETMYPHSHVVPTVETMAGIGIAVDERIPTDDAVLINIETGEILKHIKNLGAN